MTIQTDDFLRRSRALVSALGLMQRSQPADVGYAEFRRKLEKSVRLVLATADELLRQALGKDGEFPVAELLREAMGRGLINAEEGGRWLDYFDRLLPDEGGAYSEDVLSRLRAFAIDARGLEANLRGT